MRTETKTAENGRVLKPHDHITEWSVCGRCGAQIDWAADSIGEDGIVDLCLIDLLSISAALLASVVVVLWTWRDADTIRGG